MFPVRLAESRRNGRSGRIERHKMSREVHEMNYAPSRPSGLANRLLPSDLVVWLTTMPAVSHRHSEGLGNEANGEKSGTTP